MPRILPSTFTNPVDRWTHRLPRWTRRSSRASAAALLAVASVIGLVQVLVVPSSHAGTGGPSGIAPTSTVAAVASGSVAGEWETTAAGRVTALGSAASFGSVTGPLNRPVVGMAALPDGLGYWLVAADGGVFSFGGATFYGSMAAVPVAAPMVGMAPTPDGHGYWLVAADGGVFSFGDATFYGGMATVHLRSPVVGIAATPDGRGYWLVASDGGVFSFGDAAFHGGMATVHLHQPVVGIAATSSGQGYWVVASDGGVFSFGDAAFHGSGVGRGVAVPIVGLVPDTTSLGYDLIGAGGATYAFGDAPVYASPQMRGAGLIDLPTDCGDMNTLGLSWYYDWGSQTSCPGSGVPFVPMVWGDWCNGASTCPALPASLAGNGNQYLLTFNEPDNASQSNLSVARAIQLWPALEATGLQLSSPAVTNGPSGPAWLASFMADAHSQGLRVDFLALHWYGDCSSPQPLINYLSSMEASYGLPEWLTEFSCVNESAAANANFIHQVAPQLEALPYLQRFAWFTNRPYPDGYQGTGLLDANGALTPVGQAYTAIPAG